MDIEKYDKQMIYCRMLGHHVPFSYCRTGTSSLPCRKIFDCWHQIFDIEQFIKDHYTQDQINSILSPPKPKVMTLIEMIQKAQQTNGGKQDTDQ